MNQESQTPQTRREIESEIQRLQNSLAEADRLDLVNAVDSIKAHANSLGMSREIVFEALNKVTTTYERKLKTASKPKDLNGRMSQERYNNSGDELRAKYDAKKPGHAFRQWE